MTILLFLLLALAPSSGTQPEAHDLLALGHQLRAEGDLRGAAAAYEGAAATGWTSLALETALGLTYAEAEQPGRAVLHFERALRLAPSDPDAAHNLRLAREQAAAPRPRLRPAEAAAAWASEHVGADAVAVFFFALYLAALGLGAARLLGRGHPVWTRRGLLVTAPLVVLVGAAAVGVARYEAQPRAVVVDSPAEVRSAPTASPSGATLPPGTVLPVTDERAGWRAVRLPEGGTGWVAESALETL